ncbi:TetR/AcrR family transcriptional regulator [Streptomyces sp. NPDC054784]
MVNEEAPTRRSDARRNRERILAAATVELTRDADVPLSTIRRSAGVGQATFYRNFPDRDSLVLEVHRQEMRHLAEAAPRLLRAWPPDRALRKWLDELARFAMAKAGLAEALRKATCTPCRPGGPAQAPIAEAVELLLRANERAGTVRSGVTAEDFFLVTAGLWQIDPTADDRTARTARFLDLVMDGVRTRPGD